jgi:hypothetical protein
MSTTQAQPTSADLVDNGASAFCHIACETYLDKTLCGLIEEGDTWCMKDPCDNVCLVCTDLDLAATPCPVCGTDCASAA